MWTPVSRLFSRLAVVIAVVAALCLAVPVRSFAAPVAPADGYGFGQGAAPVVYSFEDINREIDAVTQTSASWLRVLVDWSKIEPTQGQYDWGYLDNIVNYATSHGLRVLGVLAYTPTWARPQGPGMLFWTVPPKNPGDFANFATAAVGRYGDRIQNWEIWNEPNLPLFFGFTDKKAERYTELLKAVYPAIKAVPAGRHRGRGRAEPAVGKDSPRGSCSRCIDAGAGPSSTPPRTRTCSPGGSGRGLQERLVGRGPDARRHGRHGDGGKKIWMTEIGAPTRHRHRRRQPAGAGQADHRRDGRRGGTRIQRAGVHLQHPRHQQRRRDNRERNFGALLTSDWQPKYTAGVLAR